LNGFQWRLEQGKPTTALPELMNSISINIERVNPKSADAISADWVDNVK
jgi:hypothetical protein